jgi:hypothetical protein
MDYRTKFESAPFNPDTLLIGDYPVVSRGVTLASGQNLKRGAVLGKVSAGGLYKLAALAAGDGSEIPDAILANDCNATAGDTPAVVYTVAGVASNALILGAGMVLAGITEQLRLKGIHVIEAKQIV